MTGAYAYWVFAGRLGLVLTGLAWLALMTRKNAEPTPADARRDSPIERLTAQTTTLESLDQRLA
jgi:hypothetical protein